MRIYDILHGRIQPNETAAERREKERIDNWQGPSDDIHTPSGAHQLYMAQREKRLDDIRMKIKAGYYEQREVLEKVADVIYRHIGR